MNITVEQIEFYLCILVRITAFIYIAPFFSIKDVPQRVKIGFSLVFALLMFEALPYERPLYATVVDYTALILKETLAGLIMGFFASASYHILAFAGHILDFEMGFSMVTEFDPITGSQVTITSNLYSYSVMIMLLITKMHLPIISAIAESFVLIPIGHVFVNPLKYEAILTFMADYFIIGFRIALPMFAAILMVNVVLAILAKVAPQMNMFVVGMQIKVLIGLVVLLFMIGMIASVSDFISNNINDMLKEAIRYLKSPF